MKSQVAADSIVEHRIKNYSKLDIVYTMVTHWTLNFDGSICNERKGIDIVLVLPRSVTFDFFSRLKIHCTNNQAKYKACLELLDLVGVKHVKVFGDSHMAIQQISRAYQCLDGV